MLVLSSNFFTAAIPPEVAALHFDIYLDLSGKLTCLLLLHCIVLVLLVCAHLEEDTPSCLLI